MRASIHAAALAALLLTPSLFAQTEPSTRASMESFQLPTHGELVNAFVYIAAGAGPHPAVVLLHGFPGNERNLDVAQAIRAAGWDVLFLDYRGSWGSPGAFSFQHSLEDTEAAVAYLREPETVRKLRLDPMHIVLLGHSMGGMMAIRAGGADRTLTAVGTISAAEMSRLGGDPVRGAAALAAEGMAPLAGCTPQSLADELGQHAAEWHFTAQTAALKARPVLMISSDDGLAAADDGFAYALEQAGDTRVTSAHFSTDHAYSDKRAELIAAVLHWLGTLPGAPRP
jgi:uncharacterized protein